MQKIYKIVIKIFILLFFSFPSLAHVQHYDNLNSIEDVADEVLKTISICGMKYYSELKNNFEGKK